jgi:ketosteroid isomerase-like protein
VAVSREKAGSLILMHVTITRWFILGLILTLCHEVHVFTPPAPIKSPMCALRKVSDLRAPVVASGEKVAYLFCPMKKSLLSVTLLAGFIALSGNAGAAPSTDKKAIAALEQQWVDAFKNNDPMLLEPIIASTWVQTSADATLSDKAHEMADTKETKWTSLRNIGLNITMYGNAAVVTGIFKGTGTASWGAVDDHYRFTDTWVKMPKGIWQCVATQLTTLTK